MSTELGIMWKEAAMAWLKFLSRQLGGGTDKTTKNINEDTW
jgi:hypothetical protein